MASKGAVLEKEAVVDFANYADQRVRVKIQGGREVEGVLKGYDKLDNLVLDDTIEYLRGTLIVSVLFMWFNSRQSIDPNDLSQITGKTRKLGLVVVRGTQISLIAPSDEMEEIANPFAEVEEEGESAES